MAGFGTINTWDIPYLFTYDAAAKHEAKVKPVRGDKNETKPLGDRRRKWYNIRKEEVAGQAQPDIIVKMHSTDIIRYHPDNSITITNGGWVSNSTHQMFDAVLRLSIRTFDGKAWVRCYYHEKGWEMPVLGEYPLPSNTRVKLKRHEDNRHWVISDIELPTIHRVKRAAANKVRKDYADFRKYLAGMLKLRTEVREVKTWNGVIEQQKLVQFPPEEVVAVGIENNPMYTISLRPRYGIEVAELTAMMRSGDVDSYYRAALMVASSSITHWSPRARGFVVAPDEVLKFFDRLLLFAHKYEVLEKETANPAAKPKRDPYAAWF